MTLPDRILELVRTSGGAVEADDVVGQLASRLDTTPDYVRMALATLRASNLVHWSARRVGYPRPAETFEKRSLHDQVVSWLEQHGGHLEDENGRCAEIVGKDLGHSSERIARIFRDLAHAGRLTKRSKTRIGTLEITLRREERSLVKEKEPRPKSNGSLQSYSQEFQAAAAAVVEIMEILEDLDAVVRSAVVGAINEKYFVREAS